MKVTRLDEQTIAIGPLDLFCTELLHQIHLCVNPDENPAVHDRLFPKPTAGADAELDSEWCDYVEPELVELFATSIDVIQKDIAEFPPARPAADHHTLHLSVRHLDAWVHGLNQARLAIAADHNFTESDMDGPIPTDGDARALAIFQVHFYGWLQECFLRELRDE
ncbi:MAG: DUF2017 family protein [Chthoniobacteraceae bacterium]